MVIAVVLAVIGLMAVAGLNGALVLYRTPSEAIHQRLFGRPLRLGGLVEPGSLRLRGDVARFRLTDGVSTIRVVYTGPLVATFTPGQDALVGGELARDGVFTASQVIVKHSNTYRAPGGKPYRPPSIGTGSRR
jgi:cytochrome c-type biogenesis protein CcmE